MAKALKTVGMIAGVVALAATGIGAIGAGAALAGALGTTAATIATVGKIATVVSIAAGLGAQALTKPPNAVGSVNQLVIGSNQPTPYLMGLSYTGGQLVHETGFGGTVDKVPNPYKFLAIVLSLGPVQAIAATQADFATVGFSGNAATGYYSGWLYRDTQLGAKPEPDALTSQLGTPTDWSSAHKLSGLAAVSLSLKFDKKGKVYASGTPQFGHIVEGVYAYDPRLDSTFPGGSGACRLADESTWVWTECPALHAGTYAYGRYQNGVKVFGVDLGTASVDWPTIVAWANVCDANGWKVGGTIYEPGDKWNNLKMICEAGAAEPIFTAGMLSFRWEAPRVALDTIALADLADGEISAVSGREWKSRLNTVTPKYRSEANQWEYVAAAPIVDTVARAEDGEEKTDEPQLTLVQQLDQAAQIAAYKLKATREAGPIVLPCKPRMIEYRAGDALALSDDLQDMLGLDVGLCIIKQRSVDPATAIVTLTLDTETTGKHVWALGQTGIAPPATTVQTGEQRDGVVSGADDTQRVQTFTVASEAEQLALPARAGDVAVRTDTGESYVHNGGTSGTMADWTLTSATAAPGADYVINGDFA